MSPPPTTPHRFLTLLSHANHKYFDAIIEFLLAHDMKVSEEEMRVFLEKLETQGPEVVRAPSAPPTVPSAPPAVHENPNVAQLQALGFPDSPTRLLAALSLADSNLDRAVTFLLDDGDRVDAEVKRLAHAQQQRDRERELGVVSKVGHWLSNQARNLEPSLRKSKSASSLSLSQSSLNLHMSQERSESFAISLGTHVQSTHQLRVTSGVDLLAWPSDMQERKAVLTHTLTMLTRAEWVGYVHVGKFGVDEPVFPLAPSAHHESDVMVSKHCLLPRIHLVFHLSSYSLLSLRRVLQYCTRFGVRELYLPLATKPQEVLRMMKQYWQHQSMTQARQGTQEDFLDPAFVAVQPKKSGVEVVHAYCQNFDDCVAVVREVMRTD